jgi:DMSO/TMAO reductase YedYZ heme-binding membrane subunit
MNPFGRARGVLADCRPERRRRTTRLPAGHRRRVLPAAGAARPHVPHLAVVTAMLASTTGPLGASGTAGVTAALAGLQRFFLAYSGVFALIALTAAVAAGLAAADRLVISPAGRVTFQAAHRALSLAAVGFLASHVLLEILAHRSRVIDTLVPFVASGRTMYLGLGTLAADLVLLIAITGVARHRFASHWTATWRGVHVLAYLAWPLAILHGLLSGRPAKPYVDWSYGACVAAVALALLVRLVAAPRSRMVAAPRRRMVAAPRRRTVADPHPAPHLTGPRLVVAPFAGRYLSAPPPVQPPERRALPGGVIHDDGTPYGIVYGVVDDGIPHAPEAP